VRDTRISHRVDDSVGLQWLGGSRRVDDGWDFGKSE